MRSRIRHDNTAEDPWLHTPDPWAAFKAATGQPSAPVKAPEGQKRIQALESTLLKSAQQSAEQHAASAVQDFACKTQKQNEARFEKLEADLTEMREQGNRFSQWIASVDSQVAQSAADLKEVQVAVSHQEVTLQNVHQQIVQQAETTQVAVQSSVNQSFQAMQTALANQMSRALSSRGKWGSSAACWPNGRP